MGIYTSPFVLLGLANTWASGQTVSSPQSGVASAGTLYIRGWMGSARAQWVISAEADNSLHIFNSDNPVPLDIAYSGGVITSNGQIVANGGVYIPSGESITGAGSLNLTGTGEFGALFTAAAGIDITGVGGTHSAAIDLTSIATASPFIDHYGNISFPNATTGDSWNVYDESGASALSVTVDGTKVVGLTNLNLKSTTATSATAGTITPPDITGFVEIQVGGTTYKLAYYGV